MSGIKVTVTNENSGFSKVVISPLPVWLGSSVFTPEWSSVLNKPSTFPPSSHTHPISEVTNLQSELDSKAGSAHTHPASDITDFAERVAEVSPPAEWGTLQNKPSTFPPSAHTHVAADITDFSASAAAAAPVQSVAGKTGAVTLAKADVGLGNVDNTSDLNKPVSTATQAALDGKANTSHTHTASHVTDFSASAAAAAPVQSVAGRTGAVTLAVADVSGAVSDSDARLTDARTPTAHKSSHSTGGTDALTPADIGAAPASHTHTPSEVGLGNVANTAQVTAVTGTAPIVSSGGTTPAISIAAATTAAAGSMSAADKLKLNGIAEGAEVNVNADWNATTGDAAILNKPSTFPPSSHTHQAADLFGVLKLATDSYIVAEAGDNLATKYAAAKALTPNGNPLSATNRAALVIMPATYSLAADLTVDAEFVDVIGLGAQKLHRGSIPAVVFANNRIVVSANNVRVQGISVGTQNFIIQSNLPLQRIEDCTGGNESFGGYGTASGTFINCVGGVFAFGGEGSAVGTFANCVGGTNSFGYIADASGSFINCVSGGGGFGSSATASGLFIDCDGPFGDFGTSGTASGTFINCTGGAYSFGSDTGAATGTFVNCTGGEYSFGGGDGYGISGNATGKFYNCRLTAGTFWPVTSGGLMRNCIDGNNNLVDQ